MIFCLDNIPSLIECPGDCRLLLPFRQCVRSIMSYRLIVCPSVSAIRLQLPFYALKYIGGGRIVLCLTHWGRVTHICVGNLTIIGSDNGLSPGRRQSIVWTNTGILLIRTSGTNVSEISSEIHTFSLKKMHFKMSSGKWRLFCFGLKVLKETDSAGWHTGMWVISAQDTQRAINGFNIV